MKDVKFYKAIQNMVSALRETKVKQITGRLSKFNANGDLLGKCALGVLTCKFHIPTTMDNQGDIRHCDIIKKCGVPNKWLNIPFPYSDMIKYDGVCSFSYVIFHLNDTYKLTFEQIADYLETTFIPEDKT